MPSKSINSSLWHRPPKITTKFHRQILPPMRHNPPLFSTNFPLNFAFKLLQQKFFTISIIFCTLASSILRHSNAAENAGDFGQNGGIPYSALMANGPLRQWREDRMVRCIFCMNYDDYNNLSTFGCELKRVHTCWGNFCYMRQHKRQEYFLYTSGCVNLTANELLGLKTNVAALASELGQRDSASTNWGNETQLCEVGQSVNTCICSNRQMCNNVSAVEPYIEYSDAIFAGIEFDELAHFRFLLPDDPILREFERERYSAGGGNGNGGNYVLVKDSAKGRQMPNILFFLLPFSILFASLLIAPKLA